MNNDRRTFLKSLSGVALGTAVIPLLNLKNIENVESAAQTIDHLTPEEAARDENFWFVVQHAFRQSSHFINLENGYFSPMPEVCLDAQIKNIRMINDIPSYYMRTRQGKDREDIKKMVAQFSGCSPEEIVLTRNTTESLNNIILGLDLKEGDEALMANKEYPSMHAAFDQTAKRFGLHNKRIYIPNVPDDNSEIVEIFKKEITSKTKVILISHMTYLSGQVLPVREVCDMAHERGIEVIVDAAHSYAHLDFKIPDLHCDYFGTSLHKWLCTPLGNGLMYIKKDKIGKVWPLFGDNSYDANDIRKFEHTGTRPPATYLTLADCIRFHNSIGSKRKEERMRYLKNYWLEKVSVFPKVIVNTSLRREQSCGIANVGIKGKTPKEIADYLFEKHKIFTVAIDSPEVKGIRVSPHIYTRLDHLDLLVQGIDELCRA